jgi:hypothetical protein
MADSAPISSFYDVDPLAKVAINLFYGWGYNFYRQENQLRADDQLVRSKVGLLLGWARKSVETAERDYRRDFLPPPSREKPRPDAAAVAGAQAIERLSRAIGAIQGQITAQPVPENDRMTQRYRQEAATLQHLIAADQKLVGQSELLRSMLDQKNGTWLIENMPALQDGINAIGETLKTRQLLLFPTV